MLVCVSPAIAVAAKSAKEANVASDMDFMISICCYLFSFDLVFIFAGIVPVICDFESVTAGEPYNPAASELCEGAR